MVKIKKVGSLLLSATLIFGITTGVAAETNGIKTEVSSEQPAAVSVNSKAVKELLKAEWKIKKDSFDSRLQTSSGQLIHNSGKPIKNDILAKDLDFKKSKDVKDQQLFAIYKQTVNGEDVEKYYFANLDNLDDVGLADIKTDAKKEQTKNEALATSSSDFVTMAAEPSGGYYRIFTWNFYSVTSQHEGKYTSNNHFVRESSNANINGVNGSVWDVHAFNSFEKGIRLLGSQTTRMSANYSAQKLLDYGPSSDAGFTVPVTLTGISAAVDWAFNVGNTWIDDLSSVTGKYGRWSYALGLGAPNPFNTEPGIRVSNTSGAFAAQLSHTFAIKASGSHSTGIVTVTLPDR